MGLAYSKILPLEVVLIIETAGNASRPSSAVSLAIESVSRQTVLPSPAARSPIGLVLSVTALTGRRAAPLDPTAAPSTAAAAAALISSG